MTAVPRWIDDIVSADVVVIGAGAAGLRVALGLASHRVAVLSAGAPGESGSSPRAQGGIAVAVGADDSIEQHRADTLAAAAGLGSPPMADLLTGRAADEIDHLFRLGMRFDCKSTGEIDLGREGAHSRDRILHADGDATGTELTRTLGRAVRALGRIRLFASTLACDLVDDGKRVCGVLALRSDGSHVLFTAEAIVLATGGLGGLFRNTTNPIDNRGGGLAMAARAGAVLTDLEFVQFHPTALAVTADPLPLITEALRGAGAVLVSESGSRIMDGGHPCGDLAPRDRVAREIWRRQARGRATLLDARQVFQRLGQDAFPTARSLCSAFELDPLRQPIPVTPAAHYHMGGIRVDHRSRTSLPGLWACGEVACTGVHGANRLASNSLLEALVFGGVAAEDIDDSITRAASWRRIGAIEWREIQRPVAGQGRSPSALLAELRDRMWSCVGVSREASSLAATAAWIEEHLRSSRTPASGHPALLTAWMVTRAALNRCESRGAHSRSDHPNPSPEWQHRQSIRLQRDRSGRIEVEVLPQPLDPSPCSQAIPSRAWSVR